jgi:DNA-binding transcriptional ArsR family regulator
MNGKMVSWSFITCLFGKIAKYQDMSTCGVATLTHREDFQRVAEVFKALGNASRVMIVHALAEGEHCVADLTALVKLDMSTVSNHLSVLRAVGIVKTERRGTQVFYTLRKPCLLNVFCCLDDFHAKSNDTLHDPTLPSL